jgi:hypothetical protein
VRAVGRALNKKVVEPRHAWNPAGPLQRDVLEDVIPESPPPVHPIGETVNHRKLAHLPIPNVVDVVLLDDMPEACLLVLTERLDEIDVVTYPFLCPILKKPIPADPVCVPE